jgi:hypothetical protein
MTEPDVPARKYLPRDSAGSLELRGGTGGITAMCSCAEFLEVYKEDVTFRIRTPGSIDPGRTNPNARFVAAMTDSVGSSSPAVARILLQGRDILDAAALDSFPHDSLAKTLELAVGAGAPITRFVQANAPVSRYLIELRNWQEHPGAKRTVVDNFALMPNDTISPDARSPRERLRSQGLVWLRGPATTCRRTGP